MSNHGTATRKSSMNIKRFFVNENNNGGFFFTFFSFCMLTEDNRLVCNIYSRIYFTNVVLIFNGNFEGHHKKVLSNVDVYIKPACCLLGQAWVTSRNS